MDEMDPAVSKRARQEEDREEEDAGLVALVQTRRANVGLIESQIFALESELSGARKKLETAEVMLQEFRGVPANEGKRMKTESPHPGLGGGSDSADGTINGRKPGSAPESLRGSAKTASPSAGSAQGLAQSKSRGNSAMAVKSRLSSSGRRVADEDGGKGSKPDAHDSRSRMRVDKLHEDRLSSEGARKGMGKTSVSVRSGDASKKTPTRRLPKHTDLIMAIRSESKPRPMTFFKPAYTASQHKRKMRCLVLNPASENQCATSGLDGLVNFWQYDSKSLDLNFRCAVDCLSPGQRHWPEDVAWHPDGHSLFCVYSADKGDCQVAVVKTDTKQMRPKYLSQRPHNKGLLNGIAFMPWSNSVFVTGGSDHSVQLWREQDDGSEDVWKPKLLHDSIHTSTVLGVEGTRHKELVLSAGADKRVIGFDPVSCKTAFRHELESKAMTVLPNTADFNLFMVQTGQANQQLHLFDIRSKTELHTFGWQQTSSATQSALITQSWSPDGYYTASGSADPKIVLFDIRFNGRQPAQTVFAHNKRVFMAIWHHTRSLLLSISSDLNIGVHRISEKRAV